jgi:hypothetical protein
VPGAGLEQARRLQLLVDLAHRHRRDAELARHGADRGQPEARRKLAAGDAVFDHPAQLAAERDRQVRVDVEGHWGGFLVRRYAEL